MRHRIAWFVAFVACWATAGFAQEAGSTDTFDIERAGEFTIEKDGLWRFEGGIQAVVRFAEPGSAPMKIRADHGSGAPSGDGTSYSKVNLVGNVEINSDKGVIKSQRAELDMASKEAVFTGDVSGALPQVKSFKCDKLIYNFKTGQTRLVNASAQGLSSQSSSVANDGEQWLLASEDVKDWPLLLKTLKTQGAAAKPSPGKRLMDLLKPEERQGLSQLPATPPPGPQNQKLIVKVLNGLIKQPEMYDEASWKDVALDDATKSLLAKKAKGGLSAASTLELNRRLFQAGFPAAVAAAKTN